MPNMGIKAAVLDFLVSRAGVPTSTDLVASGAHVTRQQASQSLASFVTDGNAGVVRVSNGIYAYTGPSVTPPSPSSMTATTPAFRATPAKNNAVAEPFLVIGKNKAHEVLVRDDNGVVYRLVEI